MRAEIHRPYNGYLWFKIMPNTLENQMLFGTWQKKINRKEHYFLVEINYYTASIILEKADDISKDCRVLIYNLMDNLYQPLYIGPIDFGKRMPFKQQEENIIALINNEKSYLGCAVGAGKTKMFVTVAYQLYKQNKKVLYITVNSMRHGIVEDAKIDYPDYDIGTYSHKNIDKRIKELQQFKHIVVSYDFIIIEKGKKFLKQYNPDLIILDEAHKVKNKNTNRFKVLKQLFYPYKKFIGASASPYPKEYVDIYPQYNLIYYNLPYNGSKDDFLNEYYSAIEFKKNNRKIAIRKPRKNKMADFITNLIDPWMLKADAKVDTKLYPYTIPIEMSKDQEEAYKAAKERFLLELETTTINIANALVKAGYLHRIATGFAADPYHPKKVVTDFNPKQRLEALDTLLDGHPNEQIIIWCAYKYNVKKVEELLVKRKESYTIAMGGMDYTKNVQDFKTGKKRIIVATFGTISTGNNLQMANVMINYSVTLNPEDFQQSIGRFYRTGQKNDCYYYTLLSKNTIEYKFYHKVLEALVMNRRAYSRDELLQNIQVKEVI